MPGAAFGLLYIAVLHNNSYRFAVGTELAPCLALHVHNDDF